MAPIEEMEEYPPSLSINDLEPRQYFAQVPEDLRQLQHEANADILLSKQVFQNGPIINYSLTPAVYLLLTTIIESLTTQMKWWAKRCKINIPDVHQPYINPEVCRLEGPLSMWPGRNYTSVIVLLGTTTTEIEIIRRGRKTGDTYTWNPNSALILHNEGIKMNGLGNIKVVCITYFSDRTPPRNFETAPISPYQYHRAASLPAAQPAPGGYYPAARYMEHRRV